MTTRPASDYTAFSITDGTNTWNLLTGMTSLTEKVEVDMGEKRYTSKFNIVTYPKSAKYSADYTGHIDFQDTANYAMLRADGQTEYTLTSTVEVSDSATKTLTIKVFLTGWNMDKAEDGELTISFTLIQSGSEATMPVYESIA